MLDHYPTCYFHYPECVRFGSQWARYRLINGLFSEFGDANRTENKPQYFTNRYSIHNKEHKLKKYIFDLIDFFSFNHFVHII